jgi:iron complex outermembrane receptor protein
MRRINISRFTCAVGVTALAVTASTAAFAADAPTDGATLEEVVVTARMRVENIRDVPVSIVALSGQDIAATGATDLKDLNDMVPNVTVSTGNLESRSNLVIRGISTEARSIGQETGVGVYLDGVYTGRAETYNQALPDIEQVEFLRGPQGTIFGKNTIAGAVSLTTIKPSDKELGAFSLDVGNYGLVQGSGFVSGPIRDGLLYGKAVVYGTTSSGYATNVYDDSKAGRNNIGGGRLELRATPSSDLEIIWQGDITREHNAPYRFEVTTGAFGNIPGPFTFDEAYPSREEVDFGGTALTINYQLGGGYALTSISAWRASSWHEHSDETWNGQQLAYSEYEEHSTYASQELRITSPANQALEWVAGLYYTHQDSSTHTPVSIGNDLAAIFGIPDGLESFDERAEVATNGYAAYANGSYHLDRAWTLTVGGRYTDEYKHLDFHQIDPDGLGFVPNIGPLTQNYSKGAFTPTGSVVFAASDQVNLYATISTGYKSGGFNVDTLSTAANLSFDPEHVTNYELGAKGSFLDGKLRADADVFHMDYKDLQITQYDPKSFSNYIGNAARAKIDGFELDLVARPDIHWTVETAVGLLNARFVQFTDQYGNNLAGNQMVYAPKVTGALALQYTTPVSAAVDLFARAEANYRGSSHPDVDNLASDLLDSRTLLNARLGLNLDHGRWIVEAYGRNLANKVYAINATTQLPLLAAVIPTYNYEETTTTYGMPRTYGVKVSARF